MFTNIKIQDTSVLFSTLDNTFFVGDEQTFGDFWVSQETDDDEQYLVAGQYPIIEVKTESHRIIEDCTCPAVVIGWSHSLSIMDSYGNKLVFEFKTMYIDGEVNYFPRNK